MKQIAWVSRAAINKEEQRVEWIYKVSVKLEKIVIALHVPRLAFVMTFASPAADESAKHLNQQGVWQKSIIIFIALL